MVCVFFTFEIIAFYRHYIPFIFSDISLICVKLKFDINCKQTVHLLCKRLFLVPIAPKLLNGYLKSIVNSHKNNIVHDGKNSCQALLNCFLVCMCIYEGYC